MGCGSTTQVKSAWGLEPPLKPQHLLPLLHIASQRVHRKLSSVLFCNPFPCTQAHTQTFCASLNPISRHACDQHPGCVFVGPGHHSYGPPARKLLLAAGGSDNATAGNRVACTEASGSSSSCSDTTAGVPLATTWRWQQLGLWHPNDTVAASGGLGCAARFYADMNHGQRQDYLSKYFRFDPQVATTRGLDLCNP